MNYIELIHRLKYFYLIPVEELNSKLLELSKAFSSTSNPETLTTFFDNIFEIIFDYSKPYSNFLNPALYAETFFGESVFPIEKPSASYYSGAVRLINLSIFHHCIIQSFYKYLYSDNSIETSNTQNNMQPYDMISKNYYLFETGFFELDYITTSFDSVKIKDDLLDYRAKYAQRYRKFLSLPDTSYSKEILNASLGKLPKKNPKQKKNPYFKVPPYLAQWTDFLYSNRSVHHFDRALDKKSSLLNIYNSLYEEGKMIINKCNNNADKLLISYPLEVIYGFQTFTELACFLSNINAGETLNNTDYSVMINDSFFYIYKLLFKNPLVYNRHFIIKYACDAILNGNFSESGYLSHESNIMMSKSTRQIISDSEKLNKGLTLLEQYLNALNNLIIPLMTDLWNYAISYMHLDCKVPLTYYHFKEYIDTYYPLITGNWCFLTAKEISLFDPYYFKKSASIKTESTENTNNITIENILHFKELRTYLKKFNSINNKSKQDIFKSSLPDDHVSKLYLEKLLHFYPESIRNILKESSEGNFNPVNYYPPDICSLFSNPSSHVSNCEDKKNSIESNLQNLRLYHARLLRDLSFLNSLIK